MNPKPLFLKRRKGFSLIEVMVVLGIVGILLSLFFIHLSSGSLGDHLSRGTQLLHNDLIFLRMRAISTKVKHRLRFTSTTEWRMERYVGGSPPSDWVLIESVHRMPYQTYISMASFVNAGANLEAKPNGLYEFLNGMSGDPYVVVEEFGNPKKKSIEVSTAGAIQIETQHEPLP